MQSDDWLTTDLLVGKIKELKNLLLCSCGNTISTPVFTDTNNDCFCNSCAAICTTPLTHNRAWDHFTVLFEKSAAHLGYDFCVKTTQKVYEKRKKTHDTITPFSQLKAEVLGETATHQELENNVHDTKSVPSPGLRIFSTSTTKNEKKKSRFRHITANKSTSNVARCLKTFNKSADNIDVKNEIRTDDLDSEGKMLHINTDRFLSRPTNESGNLINDQNSSSCIDKMTSFLPRVNDDGILEVPSTTHCLNKTENEDEIAVSQNKEGHEKPTSNIVDGESVTRGKNINKYSHSCSNKVGGEESFAELSLLLEEKVTATNCCGDKESLSENESRVSCLVNEKSSEIQGTEVVDENVNLSESKNLLFNASPDNSRLDQSEKSKIYGISNAKLTPELKLLTSTQPPTPSTLKRKQVEGFVTPKCKKISLDPEVIQDLEDSDNASSDEIIQISMKDLKVLLETAKKKARVEMEDHIYSTIKKQKSCHDSSLMETGIQPLQREPDDMILTGKTPIESEIGEGESDNDSFVPSTPKNHFNKTITQVIGTGLSSSNKQLIGKCLGEFNFSFSAHLTAADYLIAGQEQVTLKWLYARVKGIPIVAVKWLEDSWKEMVLHPPDSYILEKPHSVPIPKVFHQLDIALCPPFSNYSEQDLTKLLAGAGATVSTLKEWTPAINKLRVIVGDDASIPYSDTQLIGISSKFRAVIVDLSYFLGVLECGQLRHLQPNLLINVSDEKLSRLGFPVEMVTPDDDEDY